MSSASWKNEQPSRFPSLTMEDIGTRQKHCIDLLDLWNGGLYILLAKSECNRTEREKEMTEHLTFAIELLKKHMTGTSSNYHEKFYQDIIQHLPKNAEEIKEK